MNNKKGFTLIELLVVVLIIGILAAMALPQYFKAVERSRMSEAVALLANIAQAQQRKYLQINKYTTNYTGLDVAPKSASGSTYYTKGDPQSGTNGNGFAITLADTTFASGSATARRVSNGTSTNLQYDYTLTRYYAGNGTACQGSGTGSAQTNGSNLCADFCGIDSLTDGNLCCSDGSTATNGFTSANRNTTAAGSCRTPNQNDLTL